MVDCEPEDDDRNPEWEDHRPPTVDGSGIMALREPSATAGYVTAAVKTAVVDLTGDGDERGSRHDGSALQRPASSTPQARSQTRHTSKPDVPEGKELSFKEMVDALDEKTLRSTLVRLASIAPSAQTVIKQAYIQQTKEQGQAPMPTGFDHLSKKAWHALHTSDAAKKWATLDEVRRISATKRTLETVSGHVAEIRRSVKKSSPFDVKVDALETIRKILKSILLGSNGLAESVREALGDSEEIGDGVTLIMMTMTEEEMVRAGGTADEKGTLAQKYKWCRGEAEKYGLLKSLGGVEFAVDKMTASHTEGRHV